MYEDSRYFNAPVLQVMNSSGRLLSPKWLDFHPRVTYIDYRDNVYQVVDESSSWVHLAWKFLQDGRAWWAIAEFSEVLDPFEELDEAANANEPVMLTIPSPITFAFNVSPAGGRVSR